MKRYFVTGNKEKFNEISAYISNLKMLNIKDIPEIQSLDINEIISYKLKEAKEKLSDSDCLIIVEDTGLYLNALNGFPGPLIKFLLKSIGNDGIFNICNKLENYTAEATTSFGLYNSNKDDISFYSATIKGTITAPKGDHGFGWDQIFIPDGCDKTFAEMETIEEKNNFSMRFKALNKLFERLTDNETQKNIFN